MSPLIFVKLREVFGLRSVKIVNSLDLCINFEYM